MARCPPVTARPRLQFAAALARRGTPLAGLTDGRGRPAADRFAIYRNNVIHSLSEALGTTFPATRRLMGADAFRRAAIAYAEAHKPASPILFRYGDAFAETLLRSGEWPRHVGECARIEYARVQAFHAADAAPLDAQRLALDPEALARLTFAAHPATHLVATPDGGCGAWLDGTPCAAAAALVTRPAMTVLVAPLAAPAAAFARRLLDGAPLGEAATVDDLELAGALAALLTGGAFADMS